MDKILQVSHLTKIYKRKGRLGFARQSHVALNRVSLDIRRGQTVGVVGESGSGKSTLAEIISGILPATSGDVVYGGKALTAMSRRELFAYRRNVQIVFQDSMSSLNPKKTIGWLLEEPLLIHRTSASRAERAAKVSRILSDVGLDDSFKQRLPNQLSGGQRQRVNIALALILEPQIIIADEPVSALDVSVQAQILNLLKKLQCARALTYLFVSHDLSVVYYMSDQIIVMKDGAIVERGDSEQIFYRAQQPYTRQLFKATQSLSEGL